MRKIALIIVVGACLACASCQKHNVARNHNGYANKYRKEMDEGRTTPEQDKRFIRANANQAYELDRAVRGKKKADATRAAALYYDGDEGVFDLDNE